MQNSGTYTFTKGDLNKVISMQTKYDIKTIDITAKEWFDKVNGNSYFSAQVTLNYGLPNVKTIYLPFQYGYGDHAVDMSMRALVIQGIIKTNDRTRLWRYCEENNIILRHNKIDKCLKRDVVAFGIE
jgi:hypothetical protein